MEAEIVGGEKVNNFTHSVFVHKSLVKAQWPCDLHGRDVICETWEETPSDAWGETWERILFPALLSAVFWAQEIPDGTPGDESCRAGTGLVFLTIPTLWVISSSGMTLYISVNHFHTHLQSSALFKVPDATF